MNKPGTGREVSNRVVLGVLEVCRRRGIAEQPLVQGLRLAEGLSDPRGRHAWDEFTVFMDRLDEATGGPWGVEQLCAETIETNAWMRLLGRLILDAQDLYVFGHERIGRSLYAGPLGNSVRAWRDGVVEVTYSIRDEFRPSRPYMHANAGMLRVYPRLIGHEHARVDGEIGDRHARFLVYLPAPTSLAARVRRLFWGADELADIEPETLSSAMEIGLDESLPTAPAHAIGQRLAARRTAEELAQELSAVMDEYFCCRTTRLWVRSNNGAFGLIEGGGRERRGTGASVCAQRSLVFAGEEVGRLEVEMQRSEDSPLFQALLPWVAMAVENCRRPSALTTSEAEQGARPDPARLESQARTWGLTRREAEVLGLLVQGRANKEIAAALDTSVKTCEAHVSNVLRKANAESRASLIARFWGRP